MVGFLCRRLLTAVLTLWAVFTISFFLMRAVPGGPFDHEQQVPEEIRQATADRYGLDQPLGVQYLRELARTVTLDLGPSYRLADYTVNEVIVEGLPTSAALGLMALALALTVGVPTGLWAGLNRGMADRWMRRLAVLAIATPNFVLAGILILLFCFVWPVLPPAGWGQPSQLILPAFCLAIPFAAYVARLARAGMLETWNQEYIRTAIAKGVPRHVVVWKHAFPAAVLPVVSFLGPAVAGILTGSLVIERIFAIPGIGTSFVNAALDRDYTLAMGLVLLYTTILLVTNALVDIVQKLLDPRLESL
ncbi:MAG: ABC transporter permease [Pirellulales bacterium]|nr:ABC transporter permease [Pirellulales bacterium]